MSMSELDKIDERLKQIDAVLLSKTNKNDNNHGESDELSSIDARLAEIDSQLGKANNGYSDFSPFLELRGATKTIGGLADLSKQIAPESAFNPNLSEYEQRENIENREKLETENPDKSSTRDKLTGYFDELTGLKGDPSGTIGKFREKLGEFAMPIFPGTAAASATTAPAIAAVSTALRELGLDEGYSDIISAIGVPNFQAIAKIPGKVLRKLGDVLGTVGNDAYREAGNVESAARFLQEKVGETNIPGVVERLETYETPFKGNPAKGEAAYEPLTADIADNVGLSQYHRAKAENIPEIGKKRQTNEEVLQREIDRLASKDATPQVSQEFVKGERAAYDAKIKANELDYQKSLESKKTDFQEKVESKKQAFNQKTEAKKTRYESDLEAKRKLAAKAAEQAEKPFKKTSTPESSGRETQEYLKGRVSEVEKTAQEKAAPLYEEAKPMSIEGKPKTAFDLIDEEMKNSLRTSKKHREMRKAKNIIESAGGDAALEKKKLISDIKRKYKNDPKMSELALKEVDNVPHGTYTAEKLDQARQQISEMIEEIPLHKKIRRRALTKVIKAIDKDLDSIPKISEARSVYRDGMAPANTITEHPVLGKLIDKGKGFTKQFTVTPAEIPDRVLKGNKSISAAKTLMSEAAGAGTRGHKKMINELQSYVNSDILGNFVDASGKVNPVKFESWVKSNPGAFILYPELKSNLKNLKNAQIHVDRVIRKNEKLLSDFYKESMKKTLDFESKVNKSVTEFNKQTKEKSLLSKRKSKESLDSFHKYSMDKFLGSKMEGVNPDRIAGRILDSTNSEAVMEDAVRLVSKDKTGNAKEGLKRAAINHLKEKFKSDKFTFATLNDYINKNKKSLGKLFSKDQIEVLEKSKDLLKKQAVMERLGRGDGNSNTVPKLLENIAEMTGGKASEALFGIKMPGWIGKVGDLANSITQHGKLKYLEEALLEPKMASFLLTKDVKTKKNFFDSLNNKEDFGKWLRDSESLWKTTKESIKEVGGNFSITSQALLKAKLNDE